MINIEKRPVEDAVADGLVFVEEVDGKHPQVIQSAKVEGESPVKDANGNLAYPSGDDWQSVWYPLYEPATKTLFIEKSDYSIDAEGNHHFKRGLKVNWLPS